MQTLEICIGPTISIGREIRCLPYAGFFQQYHIILHIPGSSNNVFLGYFCGIFLIKYLLSLCSKVFFCCFKRQIVQDHVLGFFFVFLCKRNFFLTWFINLVRTGYNKTKRQLINLFLQKCVFLVFLCQYLKTDFF